MEVILEAVPHERKHILWNLIELYCYDFSEYLKTDVNETGRFGYRYLDHYWTEAGRHPFLILHQGKIIGFVLVNQHLLLSERQEGYAIAEFFILRRYRRKGLGKSAAFAIFDQFPGKWELSVYQQYEAAIQFWRSTLKEYTNNNYQELIVQKRETSKLILFF